MVKDFVSNFITDVCFVLGIDIPKITHDFSCICTDTRKEQFTGEKFFIPATDEPDSEFLFYVAHNLRVRWQFLTNAEHYDFKSAEEIGLDNFDDQPAEVDAVAFASLYMINYFQLMSKYSSVSSHTRKLIFRRMEEIMGELL